MWWCVTLSTGCIRLKWSWLGNTGLLGYILQDSYIRSCKWLFKILPLFCRCHKVSLSTTPSAVSSRAESGALNTVLKIEILFNFIINCYIVHTFGSDAPVKNVQFLPRNTMSFMIFATQILPPSRPSTISMTKLSSSLRRNALKKGYLASRCETWKTGWHVTSTMRVCFALQILQGESLAIPYNG